MSRLQDNETEAAQNAGLLFDNRARPTIDRNNAARAGVELLAADHVVDEDSPDKGAQAMTTDELMRVLFRIPPDDDVRDYPNLRVITSELAAPAGKIQYGLNGSGLMLCTTEVEREHVTENGVHSHKTYAARYVTRMDDLIMDDYAERTFIRSERQIAATARQVELAVQRHPALAERIRARAMIGIARAQALLLPAPQVTADDEDEDA